VPVYSNEKPSARLAQTASLRIPAWDGVDRIMNFAHKTAFITGGASGIGLESAVLLLEAGANVAIMDLRLPPTHELGAYGSRLLGIQGDVSKPSEMQDALEAVRSRFGAPHCAVNAAGITGPLKPLVDQDDEALDRLLAVNVRGIFLAMKYEALLMRDCGGGSIVNFASVYARGSHEAMILYGATKHAVVGLTEGAAVELAKHHIRINAVAPGPILTPFIGVVTPEIEQAVVRGIPQRRIGTAAEVAYAVLWLLSDEASYVTGATLNIDGGQAARLAGM
jgi:NAD(P)-dependent dehydrogenase (short-subunit alcohol dehydrogenase family)